MPPWNQQQPIESDLVFSGGSQSRDSAFQPMYCRQCQYDLRGCENPQCPECGAAFDPKDSATYLKSPWRRRRYLKAWAVILPCMYLPHMWLLLMDYPWNDHRWLWIKLWIILPGLVPAYLLRPLYEPEGAAAAFTMMGAATAGLLTLSIYLASRRWTWALWTTAIVALIYSCFSAYVSYGLFRA